MKDGIDFSKENVYVSFKVMYNGRLRTITNVPYYIYESIFTKVINGPKFSFNHTGLIPSYYNLSKVTFYHMMNHNLFFYSYFHCNSSYKRANKLLHDIACEKVLK